MRDDFPIDVKRTLALRVRHTCSNPDCLAPTAGPQDDPSGTVNIGVAAHITAAASGGKRFDPNLTPEQRGSIDNGIWLCQNCAKLIDSDLSRFTEALLRAWKLVAEDRARLSLGKTSPSERIIESPILELVLELDGIGPDTYTQMPVRRFLLGLKNTGKAMAKFPGIRFDRALGLSVDPFGIDGNFGFGLPQSPSQQAVIGFRGGNDHVIHIDEGLTIGRLLQQGDNKGVEGIKVADYPNIHRPDGPTHHRWEFKAINFRGEISAEGIAATVAQKEFPSESVVWARR
jgi:hypothetical protein